jgi:CTP-dependent riboflavin kinase
VQIRGTVQKGTGQGAFFTTLPWVGEQFEKAMGSRPYPGTLNIRVRDEDLPRLDAFFKENDFEIFPYDPHYCSARLKKVRVNTIPAAVVFPDERVHIHPRDILEIMSPYPIKDSLGLTDGDEVVVTPFDS